MNKVVLMGNLTKEPEIRYSQSAEPVAFGRYSLAVSRRFKRDGEPDTDFFDCVVFGKSAEFAERYFKKGMRLCVSGSLRNSSWEDKQTGQKRYRTEIVVDEQEFAESKSSFESRQGQQRNYGDSSNEYSQQKENSGFSSQGNNYGNSKQNEPDGFSPISQSIDDEDLPF